MVNGIKFCYTCKVEDIKNIRWLDSVPTEGLYLFYDNTETLLYVGYSKGGIKNRVKSHINGTTNTKHFFHEIYSIKIIDGKDFEEIFNQNKGVKDVEQFLILNLNPKYNVGYTKEYNKKLRENYRKGFRKY